jgi:hypothetical protein
LNCTSLCVGSNAQVLVAMIFKFECKLIINV